MTRCAVRLSHRQLEELAGLDDERLPLAEVHRRFARRAAERGLLRPSYERTRTLLNELRRLRRLRVSTARVLVEIAYRQRPPDAVVSHLSGTGGAPLRSRGNLSRGRGP